MTDLATTSMLYSARPAVLLDGGEDPALSLALLSLAVEETVDGLYRCEANFGNWGSVGASVDYLYFDRRTFDFGKSLAVRLGEGDAEAQVFDGRITALEGRYPKQRPPEIQVLAEDRFQDLRMTRRSRAFEDVADRDLFEQIAGEHGLTPDVDVDGPQYRLVAQVNQSDLAFLRQRARSIDAELWVEGSTLHAQARTRRSAGDLTLTYGQRLREFSVSADLAQQSTRLVAGGWDVAAKEGIAEEADESAVANELDGGEAGGALLRSAFGERVQQVVHRVPQTSGEAQAVAESTYRTLARRFVRGRGVAEGDGRLRVGAHLELRQLGELFDGTYYVCAVRHTFDDVAGYRTHFCVERPGLGGGG